ncbi:MAG: PfkB family carbohydrate kinase, partial [Vicinamibacteria bacterium]
GLPSDTFASMVERAREKKRPSLLDTSGEPLVRGLAARPSVAKPNRAEAEALLRRDLSSDASRREGVAALRSLGADTAIITFGVEGFLLTTEEGLARCSTTSSSDLRLGNPTGAGDALAAGYLAGTVRGYPPLECARLAGASAVASLAEGYGRFRPKDVRVEAVLVEEL